MNSRIPSLATALLLGCVFQAAAQQLPVPILKSVFPAGAKQDSSLEIDINGGGLEEPQKLYFSHPGITAQLVSDPAKTPARFKVTVAPGVPVGDYDIRCIAKLGISNPRTFSVGDRTEIKESEPNNLPDKANHVELNTLVNGRVDPAEDVDWFVFSAKKGQRVLIECRAQRIDSRLDGALSLFTAEGKSLAVSQDENIRDQKRDPLIDFEIPADGDYFVKFTDFMFNGSSENFYRLNIGTQPYVDFITPSGAKPGSTTEITFYGRNLPGGEKTDLVVNGHPLEKATRQIQIPAEADSELHFSELMRPSLSRIDGIEVRIAGDNGVSNAKILSFSSVPEMLEVEPNNTPSEAQRLTIPSAVTGRFAGPKDIDQFVFSAKKDEKFTIDISSQRLGSPADPGMEISGPDGKMIASIQDFNENIGSLRFPTSTSDIVHEFTAPKDGDYTLCLEHLYQEVQGGAQYQYRLQIQPKQTPDFRIACVPAHDTRIDSHAIYQGGRQRLDILAWQMNGQTQPITVEARNLPPGVSCEPITIGPGMKSGALVLTAEPGAPLGEAEIEVVGTCVREGDQQKLVRKARGGVVVWDTVNTPAISRVTRSIVLAVRSTTPFAVTATAAESSIKPGTPIHIAVKAQRRADMPSAIQLNGAGTELPPGLTIPTTTIEAGQSSAELTLATDKMKPGTYSFIVNAEAQVPGEADKKIRCIYPSNPLRITIEAPPAK